MQKYPPFLSLFIFSLIVFSFPPQYLRAMESSSQNPQHVFSPFLDGSLSAEALSDSIARATLEANGVPVTPSTLAAFAKYSDPQDQDYVVNGLASDPGHADTLSQFIIEGRVIPKDLNMAVSLLKLHVSVPSNLTNVLEYLKREFPYFERLYPEEVSITSSLLDPKLKSQENKTATKIRKAYETEMRLLRTLTEKTTLSSQEQQLLRRRGLIVKDLPSLADSPSDFSEQLYELKSDPLTTLKTLHKFQQEISTLEKTLKGLNPHSSDAQELKDIRHYKKMLDDLKKDRDLFPKDLLQEYISLRNERALLVSHPSPSSKDQINGIDEKIMALARQKHLLSFYTEQMLGAHPPRSPERQKLKLALLNNLSAEEFSGAQWAHAKGIKGQNSSILILESLPGINGVHLENFHPSHLDHALKVENIARQVAPEATILVKSAGLLQPSYYSPQEITDAIASYGLGPDFGNPSKIINLSYSNRDFTQVFKTLHQSGNHLIVWAAGNNGSTMLTHPPLVGNPLNIEDDIGEALNSVKDNIIFAGSLSRDFKKSVYSNYPGSAYADRVIGTIARDYFMERTLFTYADGIPVRGFYPTYQPESGTSYAAPVISGAAALLQGQYPDLTLPEIQMILLESAEQNFFVPRKLSENATIYYYFYDPDDPRNINVKMTKDVIPVIYDKSVYGKGILSIRQALILGEIYDRLKKENPTFLPKKLKELALIEFKEYLLKERKTKGKIILRALRKFLEKHKAERASHSSVPGLRQEAPMPKKVPPPISPRPPKALAAPKSFRKLPSQESPSVSVRDRIRHFNQTDSNSSQQKEGPLQEKRE